MITIEEIQRVTAEHFGISIPRMLGPERFKYIALARHVAIYLCRSLTKRSYPDLGHAFGDRDHTTIISACRKIERMMRDDGDLVSNVESLRQRLCAPDQPKRVAGSGVWLEEAS